MIRYKYSLPKNFPQFDITIKEGLKYFFSLRKEKEYQIDYEIDSFEIDDLAKFASKRGFLDYKSSIMFDVPLLLLFFVLAIWGTAYNLSGLDFWIWCIPDYLDWRSIIVWIVHACLFLSYFFSLMIICYQFIEYNFNFFRDQTGDWVDRSYNCIDELFSYFKYHPVRHYSHSLLFFFKTLFKFCIFLWFVHVLLQLQFKVSSFSETASSFRSLSLSEFIYFFSVSYTTLGYGDIYPGGFGSRVIVILINFSTLLSIIFWYDCFKNGGAVLDTEFKRISDEHVSRLQRIELFLKECGSDGKVKCPKKHPKLNPEKCSLCKGHELVEKRKVLLYCAWPPITKEKLGKRIL